MARASLLLRSDVSVRYTHWLHLYTLVSNQGPQPVNFEMQYIITTNTFIKLFSVLKYLKMCMYNVIIFIIHHNIYDCFLLVMRKKKIRTIFFLRSRHNRAVKDSAFTVKPWKIRVWVKSVYMLRFCVCIIVILSLCLAHNTAQNVYNMKILYLHNSFLLSCT